MRISKEPEVRKQEILDAAMNVFARKGYEATTMQDIAKEAQVVAGLCYHYFQNKYSLYQAALKRYAKQCSGEFIAVFRQTELPLAASMEKLATVQREMEKNFHYRAFFDQKGNEIFHRQLDSALGQEILPYLQNYLERLMERKEIQTVNPSLLARFLWNGQIAVLNEESLPLEERIEFLTKLLQKALL